MLMIILTLSLCLSKGDEIIYLEQTSMVPNFGDQPPYDIYQWTKQLHLETCALVAIGLRYFAIFVEDVTRVEHGRITSIKYFLGVCHQSTLEEWTFCSPRLNKKRKHKCRFKLKGGRYHSRVHRRFCDIGIMVNNKDCICETTIFGNEMYKVEGFPTCYIPPLPTTLCEYNVCGLAECAAVSVKNTVHSVECNPRCKGENPFCEYPIEKSSKVPKVESSWTKWENLSDLDSSKHRSVATCTNNSTGKGDLDCLGPGTACCPASTKNCTCTTFERNGILNLERIVIDTTTPSRTSSHKIVDLLRHPRDTDDDIEDDDSEDEDLNEDIMLEEDTEDDGIDTTTEELDGEELLDEFKKETDKELENARKNNTVNAHLKHDVSSCRHRHSHSSVSVIVLLAFIKYWN